jgi:zinc protease
LIISGVILRGKGVIIATIAGNNLGKFTRPIIVCSFERRLRIEDNPNAKVIESLNLISFDKKGAYHAPIIGFQADIESYRLRDLRDWYKQYYAPNNATLVVVGQSISIVFIFCGF